MLFKPGDELEHKAVKHAALFMHRLQACSCTLKLAPPFSAVGMDASLAGQRA